MTVSQRGLDLIARFEGFVPHAYNDPVGHCTVAFGHLIHEGNCGPADFKTWGSKANPKFTREQGFDLLRQDVEPRHRAVDELVTVPLNLNEHAALDSFVFNNGVGAFKASTLLRLLNEGKRREAAAQFDRWVHAGGVVLPGLVVRRNAEQAMFLDPLEPQDGEDVSELQRSLNRFNDDWMDSGMARLTVDGVKGPATNSRVMRVKWYLGYGSDRNAEVTSRFVRRMRHPRDPRYSTPAMIATGIARRRRFKRQLEAQKGDALWGGSRYFTNRAIEFVGNRADVTSRKRVETFGNPDSDHHVSQLTADAVDFGIAEAHTLADELAAHLGGPKDIVDYQRFNVKHPENGRLYRIQIIAGTHGTGPHLHQGARRV